jgi:hypothetical protein
MAALEEIDEACLVTTLEVPALHQSKQIIQTLLDSGFGKNRIRLILNRAPKRLDITPDELEKMLGVPIFCMIPNDYQQLYETYAEGRMLDRGSELGKQIARLAIKLASLEEKTRARNASDGLGKGVEQLHACRMDTGTRSGDGRETGWVNRLFNREGNTPEYQELKFTLHRKLLDRINLEALSSMAGERVRAEIRAAVARLVDEEKTPSPWWRKTASSRKSWMRSSDWARWSRCCKIPPSATFW